MSRRLAGLVGDIALLACRPRRYAAFWLLVLEIRRRLGFARHSYLCCTLRLGASIVPTELHPALAKVQRTLGTLRIVASSLGDLQRTSSNRSGVGYVRSDFPSTSDDGLLENRRWFNA